MSARVVVLGATGRMGRQIAAEVAQAGGMGVSLVGGVASRARPESEARALGYPAVADVAGAGPLLEAADAVLDVSGPRALGELLVAWRPVLEGRALVTGTTGLDEREEAALAALAERAPVLRAANFSPGVAALNALVRDLAARFASAEWDIEVVETHHRGKADAPSGTALALARAAAAARGVELDDVRVDGRTGRTGDRPPGEVGLHAVRGGGVVGEHRVLFLGAHERLELTHRADDRALFAAGALRACAWIRGKAPGLYGMADALGLGDALPPS
ncbi:MAG: 4-hydroxy-tetrahydrodipicolinate reductase [Gemmatimonadota bacterium]